LDTSEISSMDGFLSKRVIAIQRRLKRQWDFVGIIDGGEGCQPIGSNVLLADGTWKDISEMKVGEMECSRLFAE